MGCSDDNFIIDHNISKGLGSNNFSTNPDTTEATHTEIAVLDEERFVFFDVKVAGDIAGHIFLKAYVFGHQAQLAKIKLRAAPLFLRDIGRTLREATTLFLSTDEAGMRMMCQEGG